MQELSNLVVEELLPGESRPGDAILKVARSLLHQQPRHRLHCVQWLSSWKCQSFILETLFLDVLAGSEGSLSEGAFEGVPGPLEGVLNGIWEILEGADGDALLRGILGRAVRLGHVGDDDLCVWKRARLEELWDLGQEVQGDYGSQ